MILDPITLPPETLVYEALQLMEKHSISGVPITKTEGSTQKVEGILTHRDLKFETQLDQPVSQIMTPKEKTHHGERRHHLRTSQRNFTSTSN